MTSFPLRETHLAGKITQMLMYKNKACVYDVSLNKTDSQKASGTKTL